MQEKNWIRDPFSVNVYEQEGLTTTEEDKPIEICTDGPLKLHLKEQFVPNVLTHLQDDYPDLSKRV